MNYESTDTIAVSLLKEAVESEGCHLAEVDLRNLVIKVNGPDDVVSDCARAVAEILE
jgi:phage tail tube protein FII